MIAISYRREDSTGITGRIYDRLQNEFGKPNVFMDFDSIPYGVDFREHIAQTLDRAKVVLVVIGPEWVGQKSRKVRRIDDPGDFVRIEVSSALQRHIPIIPVLVNNAKMPTAETLPKDIAELAFRNGLILDSGIDFHHHTDRLIAGIRAATKETKSTPTGPSPEVLRRRKLIFTIASGCTLLAACLVAAISLLVRASKVTHAASADTAASSSPIALTSESASPARSRKDGTLQVNGDSHGQTFEFIDVDGEHHTVSAPAKISDLPGGYGKMVMAGGRTESVWINPHGVTSWAYTEAAPSPSAFATKSPSFNRAIATAPTTRGNGKVFAGTWRGTVHEEVRNAAGNVIDSTDSPDEVIIDDTETKWQGLTGGSAFPRNRTLSYNGFVTTGGNKQQLHATLIVHDDGVTATYTKSLKPVRGGGEQRFSKGNLRKVQ